MKASVLDLRYKMKDVLKALERHESVTLLYHGKMKGKIVPITKDNNSEIGINYVADHPFFGMKTEEDQTVEEQMSQIRGHRYDL